jgi:hypothetical protein
VRKRKTKFGKLNFKYMSNVENEMGNAGNEVQIAETALLERNGYYGK